MYYNYWIITEKHILKFATDLYLVIKYIQLKYIKLQFGIIKVIKIHEGDDK